MWDIGEFLYIFSLTSGRTDFIKHLSGDADFGFINEDRNNYKNISY